MGKKEKRKVEVEPSEWFFMGTVAQAIAAIKAGQRVRVKLERHEARAYGVKNGWVDMILLSMTTVNSHDGKYPKKVDPSRTDYLRWTNAPGFSDTVLFLTIQHLTEPVFRIYPTLFSVLPPPVYKEPRG